VLPDVRGNPGVAREGGGVTAFQDRAGLEVVWEAAAAKHSLHQLQLWWEMWLEHENRREQMRLALDNERVAA
jgi:hypothetical protein